MSTVSLCMIVKNEEKNLAACLKSVAGAMDEIIVVDTGSSDRTIEAAKEFTSKIYHFDWVNDFSLARNFSFSKGTMDFLFWLDADDIVTPKDKNKLIKLKGKLKGVDLVFMPYLYSHDSKGKVTFIQTRERLIRRERGFQWQGAVHETIDMTGFNGRTISSDVAITHTKDFLDPNVAAGTTARNEAILEGVIKSGNYSPRDLYYYAIALATGTRKDEALPYLTEFIENPGIMMYSGFVAHLQASNILLKQGKFREAISILEDYEDRNKHRSEFYCTLGLYYHKLEKDLHKAKAAYEKALKCTGREPGGLLVDFQHDYYYKIPQAKLREIETLISR